MGTDLKLPAQSLLECGVVSHQYAGTVERQWQQRRLLYLKLCTLHRLPYSSALSSAPLNHHSTFFYEFGFSGSLIWRELKYLSFWWLAYFKYCNSFKVHLCCSRHQNLLFLKLDNCLSCALYGCGPSCFSIHLFMDAWSPLTYRLSWIPLVG